MSPQITKAIDQSRSFLSTLNSRQRIVLGASLLATFGFFGILVHFIGFGELKILYAGLQPAEAQEVSRRLGAKDVRYELSKDGTSISVPAGRVDEVRMQLATEGLPRSGRQGYEIFDKPNWAGSDFAEKVNYQRALEGELERTIQTLNEVEVARVHLVMAHDSLFSDQERNAKASVVLKLRTGQISDDKIDAITHLVSSAVDNLQPQNVTVVDADGQVPLLSGGSRSGAQKDLSGFEGSLNQKLMATLTPVVGTGKVKATVSVDYDPGTSETTQELYDPNAVAVVNSQISEERQRSGNDDESSQGVPGTASNVPGSTPQAGEKLSTGGGTDSSDENVQKTENKTFAVSKTTRHLTEPSGILKKISAAVLVDDAVEVNSVGGKKVEVRRKRTPEEMKQILDIATTAIGIDATRGDRITVQNLSFVSLPNEVEVHPTWGGRVEHVVRDWSPLLKYVVIAVFALILYLSFLKPLTSRVLSSVLEAKPALTADRTPVALPGGQASLEGESGYNEPLGDFGQELAGAGSEVKRVVALKRQLVDKIKTEPAAASRLVQKWVRQSEA